MLSTILKTLEDHKAQSIQTLEVAEMTPFMDHMVICTATSTRHAKALAEHVIKEAKTQRQKPKVEGLNLAEWVLVSLNDIVVHIMIASQRELYQLEKLWTYPTASSDQLAQ
jgi:ribosome-associated protein